MKHISHFESFKPKFTKDDLVDIITYRSYDDFLDKYKYHIGEYDQINKHDVYIKVFGDADFGVYITILESDVYFKNKDLLESCLTKFKYYMNSYGFDISSDGEFVPIINPYDFRLNRRLKILIEKKINKL